MQWFTKNTDEGKGGFALQVLTCMHELIKHRVTP